MSDYEFSHETMYADLYEAVQIARSASQIAQASGSVEIERESVGKLQQACDWADAQIAATKHGWRPSAAVVDKHFIMGMFDDWAASIGLSYRRAIELLQSPNMPVLFRDHLVLASSGSSGTQGVHVYNIDERRAMLSDALRRLHVAGAIDLNHEKERRILWTYSPSSIHATAWIGRCLSTSPNLDFFDGSNLSVDSLLDEAEKFLPDVLMGYPSRLVAMAKHALTRGIQIYPQAVVCSGELLSHGGRETIKNAFGVEPRSLFGMTEGVFAAECTPVGNMHLFSDLGRFDICENHGQGSGAFAVSVLFRRTQPILRMNTDDTFTLSSDRCRCGLPFPIISGIAGRTSRPYLLRGLDGKEYQVWR